MPTDIEIAQSVKLNPIMDIAYGLGISADDIEFYGKYKAKILATTDTGKTGKLVLVTAINPTPAGEGKTTTSIGLAMALHKLDVKSVLALREPSLGPVFGVKGGAAGGGYSQVLPMEDINLHFTGDFHAITSANNLIAALLDNHITQGNALNIDITRIIFTRCMDMNDRALRNIVVGLGGKANGNPREDKFKISVASEIMAVLCLSANIAELKANIGNILIAYNKSGDPVFAKDINAHGAATVLLKDAIHPNLVQTAEHTPAIIHGGPFANIAHGCNSVTATKTALSYADYCVTEAGFGSDLGAEKFINIKCRKTGLAPDCAVLVATIRALKYNGHGALVDGVCNLRKHIENLRNFGLPVVVAINKFGDDNENDLQYVSDYAKMYGAEVALSEVFAKGGKGGLDLAKKVIAACERNSGDNKKALHFTYKDGDDLKTKITKVATAIYGAASVKFTAAAEKAISETEKHFGKDFPVCIAKTQYSLSDDPKKLGAPNGFEITITDGYMNNGAKFFTALAGNIMTMPGLPKIPAAERIDIDADGVVTGLF
ncbi:MAG: formate--tetrahydrofolate ligase [Oscillospiraceae bacterium]|jgi:formate--tetrahydrofolate ligase|nr:formate--tetrahydrofolate ligase [Oscillospiraceae bacterium]